MNRPPDDRRDLQLSCEHAKVKRVMIVEDQDAREGWICERCDKEFAPRAAPHSGTPETPRKTNTEVIESVP